MNDDDRLLLDVRSWLKDEDVVLPDAEQAGRLVAAELSKTRQRRRRWWPLPSFKGTSVPPRVTPDSECQPTSIPATNGHSPTVTGRTHSMLSPVSAIAAGALVFAIGGVLLVAQPFDQQGTVPGAEAEEVAPTWVTGKIQAASSCSGGDVVWDGDVGRRRDGECGPQTWTSSDPRLTGEVVRRWSEDVYQMDEDAIWVSISAAYLRNDDGSWACSSSDLLKGIRTTGAGTTVEEESVNGGTTTFDCVGDGGYEGLSALLVSEFTAGFNEEFSGLIFSGDFPPLPEAPAAE